MTEHQLKNYGRLTTKWLIVSVGGAVLMTVALFLFSDDVVFDVPPSVETAANIILWPVAVCEHLAGPGPSIGPPEKHWHEGTPVQFVAAVVGIAVSWMFYSTIVFLTLWFRARRNRARSLVTQSNE
jgi:hypothetical protein